MKTTQYYKLVPVAETEVSKNDPYVVVLDHSMRRILSPDAGRPDWVLSVAAGIVGVFNMERLTEKSSQR
jgi:hypothetical protein